MKNTTVEKTSSQNVRGIWREQGGKYQHQLYDDASFRQHHFVVRCVGKKDDDESHIFEKIKLMIDTHFPNQFEEFLCGYHIGVRHEF